ncbi:head-tail connector protein [Rhodoblastus acidophilus]|uniref:head-tail connector protein n=1 Tax=Rhodoblastus acidophilus TaxID=1074 RepID=UPI00222420C1|nr:head-tail connector protein [Rhodoblastus acidophilus]
MARGDLVSLSALKAHLGIQSSADDILLSSMISQISRAICTWLNRAFLWPRDVTDIFDGNGRNRIQLRNWPVVSVASVSIDGQKIPQSSDGQSSGWVLEPGDDEPPGAMQMVMLRGGVFSRGWQNVAIAYRAGYQISKEQQTVPAAGARIAALQPYGPFAVDCGVAYASGAALTPVAANPARGQYVVDSFGDYAFAAADAGAQVLLTYGYVPHDLAACALEWAADRYRHRDRIGMVSKSLGGQETAAYRITAMPDFVQQSLRNFGRIIAN